MSDKFNIKDYLNYSISGFMWILLITIIMIKISILNVDQLTKINNVKNSSIYLTLIMLYGTYLIGNILRFTEKVFINIATNIFGDFFYTALKTDKDDILKSKDQKKIKKLGILYKIFKKEPLSIGLNASKTIDIKLKEMGIYNKSKKNQYIMCEIYLIKNYTGLKYERLKNIKNFYESISFPFLVYSGWIIYFIINNAIINLVFKILIILLVLLVVCKYFDRYRFLKSNMVKDVYRYLMFEK